MALTSVGAIFGSQSKHLQRIYIPDYDDSEIGKQYVGIGETIIFVPISVYRDGGPMAVQEYIGPYDKTVAGACAVVHKDTHEVIDHIIADTTIYNGGTGKNPDGHHVIRHDQVVVGSKWDMTK